MSSAKLLGTNSADSKDFTYGALTGDSSSKSFSCKSTNRNRWCDTPAAATYDPIALQGQDISDPASVWYCIAHGDLDQVKAKKEQFSWRGPVGDTPFLFALLCGQLEIAQYILKVLRARDLAAHISLPYSAADAWGDASRKGVYDGETALHVAIVSKNLEVLNWILDVAEEIDAEEREKGRVANHKHSLLTTPAVGSFFQRGSKCYFGEFPLAFAVCADSPEIVEVLLERGARSLYDNRDSNGNTILHMVTDRKLREMFTFLAQKLGADFEKLWDIPNSDNATPLTLAVLDADPEAFQYMVSARSLTLWGYGPVLCRAYPLDQVDYFPAKIERLRSRQLLGNKVSLWERLHGQDDETDKPPSALEVLTHENKFEMIDAEKLPMINELLQKKWDSYVRRYFYSRFFSCLVFAAAFTGVVLLRNPHDDRGVEGGSGSYDFSHVKTYFRIFLELGVLAVSLMKLFSEIFEMCRVGFRSYYAVSGFALLENVLSQAIFLSLTLTAVFRWLSPNSEDVVLVMAALFVWMYVISMLLAFEMTGTFLVMMYKMIVGDLSRFCITLFALMFAFATGFYILDLEDDQGPWRFVEWLEILFFVMIPNGKFDFDEDFISNKSLPKFSGALVIFFIISVSIVLLNVLIAMMNNTFNDVTENATKLWLLARAQIILSAESEMSPSQLLSVPQYWKKTDDKFFFPVEEQQPWITMQMRVPKGSQKEQKENAKAGQPK